jgi:hypothetical protein
MLPPLMTQEGALIGLDQLSLQAALTSLSNEGYMNKATIKAVLSGLPLTAYNEVELFGATEGAAEVTESPKIEDTFNCLVSVLKLYSSDSDICVKTLNAIQRTAVRYSMGQSICEALVECLKVRVHLSTDFIADEKYNKGFNLLIPNEINGCDGVWRNVFIYHYPACESGLRIVRLCLFVLRDLTRSNTVQNRISLIGAGACEIIASLFTTHVTDPVIAHECCKAVIVLAHAGRERLITAGACAGVVEALKLHQEISENALNGCRAIYALSVGNTYGRDELVRAGACDALVALLTLHLKDQNIVREGCLAVFRLSVSSPENKVTFVSAGFCEALMLIYRVHGQSNEINVRGLIRDFVEENAEISGRFISLGATEVIPGLV